MRKHVAALTLSLCIAACGGQEPTSQASPSGEEVANRLENAADQSAPKAKEVLEKAADEAREHPSLAPVDNPNSFAQDAMKKAGEAEASASHAARKQ